MRDNSAARDERKPPYTQLRIGRWYWEPPLRARRRHGLKVQALGAERADAWERAILDRARGIVPGRNRTATNDGNQNGATELGANAPAQASLVGAVGLEPTAR